VCVAAFYSAVTGFCEEKCIVKAAIIIPARFASTRLPGKLLLDLCGKPLIQHVYERACGSSKASSVIVATDDDRIASAVMSFGGDVVMTRTDHSSGSERIAEAALKIDADIFLNVQGDEPEIEPIYLDQLIELQEAHGAFASTLACPFPTDISPSDSAAVKVIPGKSLGPSMWQAKYFTRAAPPLNRQNEMRPFLHVGVYAYSRGSLAQFANTTMSALEKAERLEQLRILEMGEVIAVREVPYAAPGVDTPKDLDAAKKRLLAS